jgi:hypothetical protein
MICNLVEVKAHTIAIAGALEWLPMIPTRRVVRDKASVVRARMKAVTGRNRRWR